MPVKRVFIFFMISLCLIGCKKEEIEIFKSQADSFPRYLILNNDTLYDYTIEEGIAFKHKREKDTIYYNDYFKSDKKVIFQRLDLNDFGFRSNQILISFETPLGTNGISFSAEISNFEYLFIRYYDFQSQKHVLKIKLEDKDKKLLKILQSNLIQYREEYKEEEGINTVDYEKLLIIYNDGDTERAVSGDLYLMPEQLKVLISLVYMYITKYSKSANPNFIQDLPSYEILENYQNKTGIGYKHEPEPVPF